MSKSHSMYLFLAIFAIVGLFLNIQWLFYSMLLLVGVLIAVESMAPPEQSPASTEAKKQAEHKSGFLDVMLGNLMSDKFQKDQEAATAAKNSDIAKPKSP